MLLAIIYKTRLIPHNTVL